MSAEAPVVECKSCEYKVESDGGACVPCSLMITANVIQGGIDHRNRVQGVLGDDLPFRVMVVGVEVALAKEN